MGYGDACCCECGLASSVTEDTDGDERRGGQVGYDVGGAGCERQVVVWDGDVAPV